MIQALIWQPNWDDVRYDFVGAELAIAECRACRIVLEDREPALRVARTAARHEWRGEKRAEFDRTESALASRTHALIEDLWSIERRIANDINDAHSEQARRVRERQRWYAELEELQRRAAANELIQALPDPYLQVHVPVVAVEPPDPGETVEPDELGPGPTPPPTEDRSDDYADSMPY